MSKELDFHIKLTEEEAKAHIISSLCNSSICNSSKVCDQIRAQLPKENSATHTCWISVKDRLPEESRSYIACNALGFVQNISYSKKYSAWNHYDCMDDLSKVMRDITHWMPVPEAPIQEAE